MRAADSVWSGPRTFTFTVSQVGKTQVSFTKDSKGIPPGNYFLTGACITEDGLRSPRRKELE